MRPRCPWQEANEQWCNEPMGAARVYQAPMAQTKRFFSERNRKQFAVVSVLAAISGSAALRAPAPGTLGCTTTRVILLDSPRAPTPARVGTSAGAALGLLSKELQHGRSGFVCAIGKGKR